MVDGPELVAKQQQLAAQLLTSVEQPHTLPEVCRQIAGTLREVAADEQLWDDLRKSKANRFAQARVAQLALLDWSGLLDAVGLARGDSGLVDELTTALNRPQTAEDWAVLRELLVRLAGSLDDDAGADPPLTEHRFWRRVRDKAAYGVSALRRVSIGALAIEAAKKAVVTGTELTAVMLVTGVPFGPAAPILAAAAAGVAAAAVEELRRCFAAEAADRLVERWRTVSIDAGLGLGEFGRMRSHVQMLDEMVRRWPGPYGQVDLSEELLSTIAGVKTWAATAGAALADGWAFVAAHLGGPGIEALHRVTECLTSVRLTVVELVDALVNDGVKAAQAAVARMAEAIKAVDIATRDLDKLLMPH